MNFVFRPVFILLTVLFSSCGKDDDPTDLTPTPTIGLDYKQEMRDFVQEISVYAKSIDPDFFIIPQNGVELVSTTGDDDGEPEMNYINAIDGIGQENLNYGYEEDDQATPVVDSEWIRTFLDMAKDNGDVRILVTDYCSTHSKMDDSYAVNNANGYISFAADHRELDNIPDYPATIYNVSPSIVTSLQTAQNFLYLINPDAQFNNKQQFINSISSTNYDLLIMDYFYNGEEYTTEEVDQLRQKANGGSRLLICYMSIGEAEDYRYYWQPNWTIGSPSFIVAENPNWAGNYVVKYWNEEWKSIIYGNDESYLKRILDSGFDGVYLDIVDGFENFE